MKLLQVKAESSFEEGLKRGEVKLVKRQLHLFPPDLRASHVTNGNAQKTLSTCPVCDQVDQAADYQPITKL
jgi:hypothetical protein